MRWILVFSILGRESKLLSTFIITTNVSFFHLGWSWMTTSADPAASKDVTYHLALGRTQRHAVGNVEVDAKMRYRQSLPGRSLMSIMDMGRKT